jgi:hypothetical protein
LSVLGKPQHEWDEFLEEASRPRRRLPGRNLLWVVVPVAVLVVVLLLVKLAGN